MSKKKHLKSNVIASTQDHIRRIFPHVNDVEIKVGKDEGGNFESLIRVRAKDRKDLIAYKKDKSLQKSLNKSYHAILRQIHRVKTRWDRRRNKIGRLRLSTY